MKGNILNIISTVHKIAKDIQQELIYEYKLSRCDTTVGVDLLQNLIYLQCNIVIDKLDYNSILFENDILLIKIEGDIISLNSTLYSDYGIDNVESFSVKISDFDIYKLNNVKIKLIAKIKERIKFYIS